MGSEETEIVKHAKELFKKQFGGDATVAGVAPGRVNLIGEHTDYNDGFVFPLALQKNTVVAGRPAANGSKTCTIYADLFDLDKVEIKIEDDMQPGEPAWSNYLRGMISIYRKEGFEVGGFDAVVCSHVPLGAGVSSSAALEMSTATFIEGLLGRPNDSTKRALWGQKCEHTFIGLESGIMDQFISSKATAGDVLLIDCRSYKSEEVPLNDPEVYVLVVNSNVKHSLTGSEYPTRVRQCREAAKALSVKSLRDATMEDLERNKHELSDETFRRARHVITEDARVLKARDALRAHDYVTTGKLMLESHISLRDDYEVSVPEIDFLVDTAMAQDGVYGSRITGGGFGGCTVTLVKASAAEVVQKALEEKFLAKFDKEVMSFITQPGEGAHSVKL